MLVVRVVVIGGGVAGASTAYHASLLGAETVLVDRELPGQATAAGAGIVCPWSSTRDPAWHDVADTAAAYYPTLLAMLAEDGQHDIGYRTGGALRLGAAVADIDATPTAGEISAVPDGRELFPPLRPDSPGVFIAGGARVDGRLLRDALRAAAVGHGTTIRHGTATLSDRRTVLIDGERIEADAIVVAAGAWCPEILDPIGITVHVAPQRGQITHLRFESDVDTSDWPAVLPRSSHYLLAFDGGRVVVGATRETGSGFDHRVTAAGQAQVLREALAVAPGLADTTLVETRIGFRPAGPDSLPLLGDVDGIVVATGLGPSGLTLGPYVGRLAAAIALHEEPGVDVRPFDPLRG